MGLYDRTYLREEDEPERSGSTFDIVRDLGAAHWIILLCVALWVIGFFTNATGFMEPGGKIEYFPAGLSQQERDDIVAKSPVPVWRWLPEQLALKTDFYVTQPWSIWRLATYAFVHAPMPLHLLFNCLGLWLFGKPVEERLGARGLTLFYLVSIVIGGGVAIIYHVLLGIYSPGQAAGLVLGASGGVSALAVLFACLYPDKKVVFFPFPVALPAWGGVALFLGAGLVWSFFAGDATATPVHLAGMAVGLAVGLTRDRWLRWIPGYWTQREELKLYQGEEEDELPEEEDDYGYAFTAQADEQQRVMEQEADRLLDKVHREGTGSLTDEERRTLEDYSRKMREKKRR